jgi:hypothetical protein
MSLHRISVKVFVQQPAAVDPKTFVPVFQRWIQQHSVEGLLIDVVDYKHVQDGPGVILIGYEADYALDLGGGRPGLLYVRKREIHDDLQATLRDSLRRALKASALLEGEQALNGIAFNPQEIVITFLDRLHTPNQPETLDNVRGDLQAVLDDVYGAPVSLEVVHEDPRYLFAVRALALNALALAELVQSLDVQTPVSS